MRRPSGDSSTLPTARKRERSLLAKPCAAPELANINSAAQQRLKPARGNADCKYRRMGLSLNSGVGTGITAAILGRATLHGQLHLPWRTRVRRALENCEAVLPSAVFLKLGAFRAWLSMVVLLTINR